MDTIKIRDFKQIIVYHNGNKKEGRKEGIERRKNEGGK